MRCFLFITICLCSLIKLQADSLLDALLKRNGDIYLLISKPSAAEGNLFKFERAENYSRSEPIPPGNNLRLQLPYYIGFSVDKFGHIKLFRAENDPDVTDPTLGGASIISPTLLGRVYPGVPGTVPSGSNTMITAYSSGYMSGPDNAAITAVGAGWRYIIAPDGKEGWKKIMVNSPEPMSLSVDTGAAGDSPTVAETNLDATTGSFRLQLPDPPTSGTEPYPAGSIILPPLYKSYPLNYVTIYHSSGFWRTDEGRHQFRAEAHGAPVLVNSGSTTVLPGASFNIGDDCGILHFRTADGDINEVLWDVNAAKRCDSAPFSPPVGAVFLLPHVVRPADRPAAWDFRLGDPGVNPWHAFEWMRAAAIVRDVRKNKIALSVDSFLSDADNTLLKSTAESGSSAIFDDLDACSDYFDSCTNAESDSEGNFNSTADGSYVLASTISYSVDLSRLNHCGDLCGAGAADGTIAPPPPPSSTAYASSFGRNQAEQKVYLLKSGSVGGTNIVTSVVQVQIDGSGVSEIVLIDPEDSPGTDVKQYAIGSADTDFSETPPVTQIVYKTTAADIGCGSVVSGDFMPNSLGFSKRRDGSTDFVYYSDLPPTHFAVSSNFWGTGGTLWCADDSSGSLILHYRAYNHKNSGTIDDGSKNIGPRNFLTMAADGDNSVYIVHADPSRFEGIDEMDRLLGTGINATTIKKLCEDGLITSLTISSSTWPDCATINFSSGYAPSISEPPVPMLITLKQHAGFVVEKIPAIAGAGSQTIGIAPVVEIGTCTAGFVFNLSAAETAAGMFRAETNGTKASEWVCTGDASSFSAADLDDTIVRLGIVNVPNPPSSGTDLTIDIVNPCPAQGASCSDENILEDKPVIFRMENPPHFAGVPAMINQASDDNLQSIGLSYPSGVRMLSNYDETGMIHTKDVLGAMADLYYDDDDRIGALPATALNVDYSLIAANPDPKLAVGTHTMRYRWQVRALTPPHSLVDYSTNPVPFTPPENLSFTYVSSCSNVRLGMTTYVLPNENPSAQGLLYDSCWMDMDQEVASASTPEQLMFETEQLSYKFVDPGSYQVNLLVAALAYDLSGVTYLTDPESVRSMAIVTGYSMPVTVQASAPGSGNPFVREVRIGANDLQNASTGVRVGDHLPFNDFRTLFATEERNGLVYNDTVGATPIYPVHYYRDQKLIVTHQDQLTPLYAEATIQFAHAQSIEYAAGSVDLQTKVTGVGSWDFDYTCTPGSCPVIGGITLQDKSSTHPANYLSSVAGFQITTDYGNDATARSQSSRYINAAGAVLSSVNFADLQQGTLSDDIYYPSGDIVSSPHAFYSWYDIKYAWFIRYRTPDPSNTVKTRVLRTGNLAEVFLLNYYANSGTNAAAFKTLLKSLAPDEIKGAGAPDLMSGSPHLIQPTGNPREFHIRIPLMDHNSLLSGNVSDELDGSVLYSDTQFNAAGLSYQDLLSLIKPMRFPIPTGSTVLEIGFQVFAPILAWEGRQPVYNSLGTVSGYAYYDAVPAVHDGSNIVTISTPADAKYGWCFGLAECFNTWKHPGILKNGYSITPALDFGLELDPVTPGFDLSAASTYNPAQDHFVEVFVSDMENPFIAEMPASPTIAAGSALEDDLFISIQDNSPYSEWLDSDGGTLQQGVPVLSNLYYETGYDPRNSFGLGLKDDNNYSFLVSHREPNTATNLAFRRGNPRTQVYPGEDTPGLDLNATAFFYGENTSGNFRTNGLFLSGGWAAGDFSGAPNEATAVGFLFPPALADVTEQVYTSPTLQTAATMNYNFLVPHFPTGDLNTFGFPTTTDTHYKIEPRFADTERGGSCLQTNLPNKENPDNCYIKSSYRINKGSIIAPWFFNNDFGISLKMFAVGQDARVYAPYPDAIDNTPAISDFYYRLAGKNNAAVSSLFPVVPDVNALLVSYWNQATNPLAEQVGVITVNDESPPNLRITITDHKTRIPVHFALTTVQALADDGSDGLYMPERADLFRSPDGRDAPLGGATAIETRVDASSGFDFRISDYASSTADPTQFFYNIPEDTRFEVTAAYSDNVTGRTLDGTISIKSGSCPSPSSITGLYPSLNPTIYPIPEISANLQYIDTAQVKTFHLYPKAGFYDEIRVEATDQAGNITALCIPIRVIEQAVLFRRTGQERGIR